MTRRNHLLSFLVVCVSVLVFALPALADSQARIVRLSDVQGSVDIDRHTGAGYEQAILNMPITQGMLLRTGDTGRAEVEFEDGTALRLTPNTVVDFQRLLLLSSGAKATTIAISDGTAYINYRHKGDNEFSVAVGGREIPVQQSAHFRVSVNSQEIKLAVFDGRLELEGPDGKVNVRKNETATLDVNDNGRYLLAKGFDTLDTDAWDKDRESYHQTYANNSSYDTYPYYGRGDLGYYGSWYSVPGYGACWRPWGVGYNWDPFYNGYWTYVPGWGYMFTSGYPWGWLPYRYGHWSYIPGWGWGWMPGRTWVPVAYPVVVNPPSGWVRPTPPPPPVNVVSAPTVPSRPPYKPTKPLPGDTMTERVKDNPKAPAITTAPTTTVGTTAPSNALNGGTTSTTPPAGIVAVRPPHVTGGSHEIPVRGDLGPASIERSSPRGRDRDDLPSRQAGVQVIAPSASGGTGTSAPPSGVAVRPPSPSRSKSDDMPSRTTAPPRAPESRPSTPARVPESRPSTPARVPESRPSTPARIPESRPSTPAPSMPSAPPAGVGPSMQSAPSQHSSPPSRSAPAGKEGSPRGSSFMHGRK